MTKIGFIGLGHMGGPMVRQLLKHEHPVIVFDKVPAAIDAAKKSGAMAATSLADLCREVEVIITMLPASEHVKTVCTAQDGIFAHAAPNTLIIDSSSIDVSTSRELETQAVQHQLAMVDAPVSGGMVGAEAGTLTFMVGGASENFERAKPILSCMGKAVIHAGAPGNGQVAKICNNMLLGASMIAVSEAFHLAEKLGLNAKTFFDISSISSGQCWSMTSYCPAPGLVVTAPSNHDYQAGFTADMMLKDLRLSQTAAQSVGASTPLGAEATALYTLFTNLGFGQKDFSAIIRMLKGEV